MSVICCSFGVNTVFMYVEQKKEKKKRTSVVDNTSDNVWHPMLYKILMLLGLALDLISVLSVNTSA